MGVFNFGRKNTPTGTKQQSKGTKGGRFPKPKPKPKGNG